MIKQIVNFIKCSLKFIFVVFLYYFLYIFITYFYYFIYLFLKFLSIYLFPFVYVFIFKYWHIYLFCRLSLHSGDVFIYLSVSRMMWSSFGVNIDIWSGLLLNRVWFLEGVTPRVSEWERERDASHAPVCRSDRWLAERSLMSSVYGRRIARCSQMKQRCVREDQTEEDEEQRQTHPSWKSHPGRSVYTHNSHIKTKNSQRIQNWSFHLTFEVTFIHFWTLNVCCIWTCERKKLQKRRENTDNGICVGFCSEICVI